MARSEAVDTFGVVRGRTIDYSTQLSQGELMIGSGSPASYAGIMQHQWQL
jgi:hypothetical protein